MPLRCKEITLWLTNLLFSKWMIRFCFAMSYSCSRTDYIPTTKIWNGQVKTNRKNSIAIIVKLTVYLTLITALSLDVQISWESSIFYDSSGTLNTRKKGFDYAGPTQEEIMDWLMWRWCLDRNGKKASINHTKHREKNTERKIILKLAMK